mmetsp:Transcript_47122/g.134468  ORF Transcript_47122/g.134468 Transcript_47122/m.134468 type:complete len:305 (+) Transcript_47122:1159-2073(+)
MFSAAAGLLLKILAQHSKNTGTKATCAVHTRPALPEERARAASCSEQHGLCPQCDRLQHCGLRGRQGCRQQQPAEAKLEARRPVLHGVGRGGRGPLHRLRKGVVEECRERHRGLCDWSKGSTALGRQPLPLGHGRGGAAEVRAPGRDALRRRQPEEEGQGAGGVAPSEAGGESRERRCCSRQLHSVRRKPLVPHTLLRLEGARSDEAAHICKERNLPAARCKCALGSTCNVRVCIPQQSEGIVAPLWRRSGEKSCCPAQYFTPNSCLPRSHELIKEWYKLSRLVLCRAMHAHNETSEGLQDVLR